ncbi:hypothetical protein M7I_2488 [Glarea lozoyensis 74030]|uniref:Uncharacterized protein n=1 Tax=Glarea lozoyensis (strain ATCC 74030 / MF5533) TaxID=1104152 RepID=H0EIX0_GLAL7|nr:hypothetical protein M7I_2488 [Glarea lozoyensis 74030]
MGYFAYLKNACNGEETVYDLTLEAIEKSHKRWINLE